jgi:hypothetical protein
LSTNCQFLSKDGAFMPMDISVIKKGMGPIFYAGAGFALMTVGVFFLRDQGWGFGPLAALYCVNFIELLIFALAVPLFAWHVQARERGMRRKEYKRLNRLSHAIARYSQKNPKKPIVAQQLKLKGFTVEEIAQYLAQLSQKSILRAIQIGDNRFQFVYNEQKIRRFPKRPARFPRPAALYALSFAGTVWLGLILSRLFFAADGVGRGYSWVAKGVAGPFEINHNLSPVLFGMVFVVAGLALFLLYRGEKRLHAWLEARVHERRESSFLRLARRNRGAVNSAAVSLALGIPLHRAREYLDYMVQQGLAQRVFNEDGRVLFRVNY